MPSIKRNGKPSNGCVQDDRQLLSKSCEVIEMESGSKVEVADEREKWGRKADFMLSCIGYAVGLGNIWRFPYLCYKNGGATFLIPYFVMLFLCGIPLFYMELALGQNRSLGPIGTWASTFVYSKGIGYAMIMVSFLVCIYYNVIITWCLYYLFHSFTDPLPWHHCGHEWNTPNCRERGNNVGTPSKIVNFNTTATSPQLLPQASPQASPSIRNFANAFAASTVGSVQPSASAASSVLGSSMYPSASVLSPFNSFVAANATTALNATQSVINGMASVVTPPVHLASTVTSGIAPSTSIMQMASIVVNGTSATSIPHVAGKLMSPSEEFWNYYVLDISENISEVGGVRWQLALTLLLAWIGIYFCIWKGVKSSGKVVYVTATFPYLVLVILLIRGVTLPGASKGILFYVQPEWKKLATPQVWVDAASQIFYSLGIGFGSLVAMGSYNKFNNNVFADAMIVALTNCFTSVFAGFVVFSVLGFISYQVGLDVADVATSGAGLAFVVYPEGVTQMPISPIWAVLFFIMLLTLGLDSQFAMSECVVTGIVDEYPTLKKNKSLFILLLCVVMFLLGLTCVTRGGVYVLELLNWQSGSTSLLFIALCEVLVVSYVYGVNNFLKDIGDMIGHDYMQKPFVRIVHKWFKICWCFISPVVIVVVMVWGLVQWKGVTYEGKYYPFWAEVVGWIIAASSMIFIPILAIITLCKNKEKYSLRKNVSQSTDNVLSNGHY